MSPYAWHSKPHCVRAVFQTETSFAFVLVPLREQLSNILKEICIIVTTTLKTHLIVSYLFWSLYAFSV